MRPIIGLTGGVASGKSTAASLFVLLGAGLIDADAISRNLTSKHGEALPHIAKAFGEDFIEDGALDRTKMRNLVFQNKAERLKLEAILHPLITKEIQSELKSKRYFPYILLDAALLTEKEEWRNKVDRILVIDVPEELQIERLIKARGLSKEIAQGIIKAQASREERLRYADDVIVNTGSIADLAAEVSGLNETYLKLDKEDSF